MYNVVELFSGIGSQAKALKNLGYNINLLSVECVRLWLASEQAQTFDDQCLGWQ